MEENKLNIQDIQRLLSQINSIKLKYDQIAELTGERFNVFSILNLQDSETRLHSKLINELLNPKGRHGQKDLFLKHLVDVVNSKITDDKSDLDSGNISKQKIKAFNTTNATAEIEKHAGFKNEDSTEGGRIDILIQDDNKYAIIIENKIWASDQEKQLLRYHNYGKGTFKKFHLLYLTINGDPPSEWSTVNSCDYLCLSYKEDIIKWLELCRKECAQLPIIRETLTQYINQLKTYSHQSITHMETEEIIKEIAKSEKNIDTVVFLDSIFDKLKKYLVDELIKKIKALSGQNDIDFYSDSNLNNKESRFYFYKPNWDYCVEYQFSVNNFEYLHLGIKPINKTSSCDKNIDINSRIEEIIRNEIKSSTNDYWNIYIEYVSEWGNTSWSNVNTNKTAEILFTKAKSYVEVLDKAYQTIHTNANLSTT
ncbi:MAG: PD-(D/E)XK nuclease family protein [Chitinophagales bacterium]